VNKGVGQESSVNSKKTFGKIRRCAATVIFVFCCSGNREFLLLDKFEAGASNRPKCFSFFAKGKVSQNAGRLSKKTRSYLRAKEGLYFVFDCSEINILL